MSIKKHKENYEVNVFSSSSHIYSNILTHDPKTFAQVLIDLYFLGFPIEKAIKIFSERMKKQDWLGF